MSLAGRANHDLLFDQAYECSVNLLISGVCANIQKLPLDHRKPELCVPGDPLEGIYDLSVNKGQFHDVLPAR